MSNSWPQAVSRSVEGLLVYHAALVARMVVPTGRSLRAALVLSFICGSLDSCQDKGNSTSSGDMYLLAGTPTVTELRVFRPPCIKLVPVRS